VRRVLVRSRIRTSPKRSAPGGARTAPRGRGPQLDRAFAGGPATRELRGAMDPVRRFRYIQFGPTTSTGRTRSRGGFAGRRAPGARAARGPGPSDDQGTMTMTETVTGSR